MSDRDRGQSEVIGVVLLLGITIAAITVTVATGSAALGLVTDEARSASVENGMSQLSSQSSLVALGETDARRFDLGSVDAGQLRLDEDAGHVTIRVERENAPDEPVYDGPIGTLVYEGERRDVALQGGGVWASQDGHGWMISPPEYHYHKSTLTFPIVKLEGGERSPSSGTGVVRRSPATTGTVDAPANPLQNGTVVVEVQSAYYEGWYDFFAQRADGSVTKDDANQTVTTRLVVPDEVEFDKPVTLGAGGYSHQGGGNGKGKGNGNAGLDESLYSEGNVYPSPGPAIESELANADENGEDLESDCFDAGTCTAGAYHASGDVTLDRDVDFDTSDGDVVVAVDGDLELGSNSLEVTDTGDGTVRYYVNGSVFANGDASVGTANEGDEAQRNQFFVRDGFLEDGPGQGNVEIDAIVYAPNSETDLAGSVTLRGGFVFESLSTRSNAFTVEPDGSPGTLTFTIPGGADRSPITYLHVSENVVKVDFDG
ncbi:hypothetical protein GJ633_08020 [Halorubrum sp. CBA1125]|uniref:DUF7289 family protein n=1 Tax=Halorubrum sp. CBA1125 TaxID=2668072 RepID=UPI0012E74EA9|nr:archaellin/type IV pilin N-terminal domain-containing protein [Halorubrum sp. CBA1125]MUW14623.1 hypothetical protein [Halorubrum sp. CBA1125]